jgi:hypothetical protein
VDERKTSANIVLAIVGLTVVNSAFVILLGICANVGLTFSKCPTIGNTCPLFINEKMKKTASLDAENNNYFISVENGKIK